jgi:anti-sigma B factor antagonist
VSILDFKVSSAELGTGVASVVVGGEVDLSTAPELKEVLNGVIDGGARLVLVDLSTATFIDSTTLGVLMGAVKRVRPDGGEIAIACMDPNIRKIFEITLLDRVFAIFDTPEEGAQHLRRGASDGGHRAATSVA